MTRSCGGVLLVLACALVSRPSFGQSQTKTAVAEALYRQARDLMAAGKLDEACPKFAESQRLDPATGTLLNLAACHEGQGKLATAWLEYSDAVVAARRDGRQDRVEYATARAAALEPKLSRLTLVLGPDADDPSLVLELDGASFGRAAIGAPTPVDPGKHTVRASATGKKPWQREITIGAEADQQTVTIPRLEEAPVVAEPVASTAPGPAPLIEPTAAQAPARDELGARPIPRSVYLAGGVTLVLAAGAGVTGFAYWSKRESYQNGLETRDRSQPPSQQLVSQERTARRWGYANAGFWAATAVGAGFTTYLYLTRPTRPSSARLVPLLAPGQVGLGLSGEL